MARHDAGQDNQDAALRDADDRLGVNERIATQFRTLEPVPGIWRQLLVAVGASLLAFAVRALLDPWLRDQHPYVMAFAAVAVATRLGTWRAGLVSAVLSFLATDYFLVQPRGSLGESLDEIIGAAAFFALAVVILYQGHRANRATRELKVLVRRLAESDARKSDFLGVLAHEIRNPLSALGLAAELLGSDLDAAARQRALETARRQVNQMSRLTHDLMDAAAIQNGKVALDCAVIPIRTVLEQSVEAVRQLAQQRKLGMDIDAPAELCVEADRARIVQVFSNLLHNACKFSPEGARIRVEAVADDGHVCVKVVDQGIGIPADKLEWVFDTYAQMTPGGGGLGLGLSLVRRLVQLHGGTIRALSRGTGEGATFEVCLPAVAVAKRG